MHLFKNVLSKVYFNHLQNQALIRFKNGHFAQAFMIYLEMAFYGFDIGRVNANIIFDKYSIHLAHLAPNDPWQIDAVLRAEPDLQRLFSDDSPNVISFVSKYLPELLKNLLESEYNQLRVRDQIDSNFRLSAHFISNFVFKKVFLYSASEFEANNFFSKNNQFVKIFDRNSRVLASHGNRFGMILVVQRLIEELENNFYLAKMKLFTHVLVKPHRLCLLSKFSKSEAQGVDRDYVLGFKLDANLPFETLYTKQFYDKNGIDSEGLFSARKIRRYLAEIQKYSEILKPELKIEKKYLNEIIKINEQIERKEYFVKQYEAEYRALGHYFTAKFYQLFGFYFAYRVDLSLHIQQSYSEVSSFEGV